MERKTNIHAEDGKQELWITRAFQLPVESLFEAFAEPEIVEQWMGTNVIKLENKQHGSYEFETIDPKGNKHRFNGVIHTFIPNQKIVRTFEMEQSPFGAQLEILTFENLTETSCKLTIHVVYQSANIRDQILQLPFAQGINMAHNRIQDLMRNKK
jgi:uncharacterized protein YndB with AHSA1/START domain